VETYESLGTRTAFTNGKSNWGIELDPLTSLACSKAAPLRHPRIGLIETYKRRRGKGRQKKIKEVAAGPHKESKM